MLLASTASFFSFKFSNSKILVDNKGFKLTPILDPNPNSILIFNVKFIFDYLSSIIIRLLAIQANFLLHNKIN